MKFLILNFLTLAVSLSCVLANASDSQIDAEKVESVIQSIREDGIIPPLTLAEANQLQDLSDSGALQEFLATSAGITRHNRDRKKCRCAGSIFRGCGIVGCSIWDGCYWKCK